MVNRTGTISDTIRPASAAAEAVLLVDHPHAGTGGVVPAPDHEVAVGRRGGGGLARVEHGDEPGGHQPLGEAPARGLSALRKVQAPGAGEVAGRDAGRGQGGEAAAVEGARDRDLVGAQGHRLEAVGEAGLGLAQGADGAQGEVKGGRADAVEPAALEPGTLARAGVERPAWVVGAVAEAIPAGERDRQAKPPSATSSR